MGPRVGGTELVEALLQAGKDLLRPYSSTDSIFDLLNKVESLLVAVDQDPILQVKIALKPSMQALVSADLLRNPDSEVRVYVVSCLAEIMRITAPEAPYNDDQMKEVFEVTVEAFGKLAEPELESYKKAEAVLDTFAKVRSSLVMLDLECDDLILKMFWEFLKIIRWSPDCPQPVLISMETIMVTVLDESEQVSIDLLKILLGTLRKEILDVSPVASRLVEKVVISCACKLGPDIMEAFKSTGTSLDMYSPVVSSICQSKASLPSKVGQTNQPVVISLSPSSKARKGSRKRSRSKMEETNKSELGEELVGKSVKVWWPLDKKFYDGVIKSYSSLNKMHQVSYSDGDSENLNLKDERWEIISEESNKSELGEELVGKRVKVWWPLDKKFYDGVIKSYSSLNKMHQVSYSDGDSEELNLKDERWEIISEEKEEIDLPDSTPLSDISWKKKDLAGTNEPERREEINPVDCYDKGEYSGTKGEDSLEITKGSNAEPECKRDQQEPPEDSNAEAKSDGEELIPVSG